MNAPLNTGLGMIYAMRRVRRELGQEFRYAHTLRVTRMAERLARLHGADVQKARLAGLFHDLARLYSGERLLAECTMRGMPIDAFERANPIVLHARLGAELAREFFGVTDEAILSAIRKHTVAAAFMSRLDQIVYLADGLEPGRTFAARAGLADLAERDLDAALRAVLQSTLAYLEGRGLAIAPQTRAAAETLRPAVAPVASVSPSHLETPIVTQRERAAAGGPADLSGKVSPCPIS